MHLTLWILFHYKKVETQVSLLVDIKFKVILLKLYLQFPGSELPMATGQLPSVVTESVTKQQRLLTEGGKTMVFERRVLV